MLEFVVLSKFDEATPHRTQVYSPHSALQLLRHVLVTKTRQFSDTTSRNSLTAAT